MHMPTTKEKLKRQKMVHNPRPQETRRLVLADILRKFMIKKFSAVFL